MIEQPLSLVMFMSFVKFIIILSIVLSGAIVSPSTILKDIKIIKPADIALLILIAIIFTIGRILFSTLLKHHDPRTIKISGYMISTVVSGGALYVMKRKNFTTSRYVGFALMALGGFLYIN
jgi:protein-S-isoprenylcysteine O-methyltransferase Ste14